MTLSTARRWWSDIRNGFWFLPSLLLLAHVGLAAFLTSTDLAANKPWMSRWPNLFGAGADGARGMLSTIAGSMMTVVGVTMSMTLVTLALASSQYSSRILRNFIRDRLTQFVLGLFAGIYCYSLIVLRTIRGGDEGGFVPGLAVLAGVILAVSGISVLIYFIHHIATSIQASNVIASVAAETMSVIEGLYPEDAVGAESGRAWDPKDPLPQWTEVTGVRDGYIERIDFHKLRELAEMHGTTVRIDRAIGDFVVRGAPILAFSGQAVDRDELSRALTASVDIGRNRTGDQDVAFGIRQLVDIALRALSPGINDTTTAVMCIDYLTAILTRLAPRAIGQFPAAPGRPQVVIETRSPTFASMLAIAFDQIREAGRGNVAVLDSLLGALETLVTMTTSSSRQSALAVHIDLISDAAGSVEGDRDRARLTSKALRIRSRVMLH